MPRSLAALRVQSPRVPLTADQRNSLIAACSAGPWTPSTTSWSLWSFRGGVPEAQFVVELAFVTTSKIGIRNGTSCLLKIHDRESLSDTPENEVEKDDDHFFWRRQAEGVCLNNTRNRPSSIHHDAMLPPASWSLRLHQPRSSSFTTDDSQGYGHEDPLRTQVRGGKGCPGWNGINS